jgi:predicted LPLAT superfamily acyltransferase
MSKRWQERPEAGSEIGMKFTVFVARRVGRTALRVILIPISLYFFLVRKDERRASREYLSAIRKSPASLWQVFRHFLTFSQVVADRIYFLTDYEHRIRVRAHGLDAMRVLAAKGKGGIVLAAHFGSFEAARVLGDSVGGVKVRVVLDRKVNAKLIRNLERVNPDLATSIIDTSKGAAQLGLAISEAAARGQWIGFLADRYQEGDRTLSCDFLGRPAKFPVGPYIMAAALHLPVICLFPALVGKGYEIYCEVFAEELSLPREERAAKLALQVQRFVSRLEFHLDMHPYNWFNFYDFWEA